MNPCPQCGAIPQPTDKFCNICGTPVSPPGFGAPAGGGAGGGFPPPQGGGQGFGAPPPQQGMYGAPPGPPPGAPLRCQMGHEIAPGQSYCAHGHPIALEAMPFANDQYGGAYGQQPGFGGAPPPQGGGFGAPPPQGGGFGFPDQGQQNFGQGQPYQDPNAGFGYGQQPGFGAPPGQPGQSFGAPPPQPYGAPGAQPGGFGGAPPAGQPGGFGGAPPPPGGQPGGFGGAAPAGQSGGFAAPEQGAPPPAAPLTLPANALRGFLVSYQSNSQGDFWPLHGGRKTVGRANSGEQVDIPLSDATISSRHAAVVVDGTAGTIQIEDTGSTNGTFVNEEHIGFNGKRELRDGDKIRFGGYSCVVKVVRI